MIDRGNRILPDQCFLGHQRPQIPGDRSHVTVRELVPGLGERFRKQGLVLSETPRDFFIGRVHAQRKIRSQHRWRVALRWVVRSRNQAIARVVLGRPLMSTSRAFGRLPLEAKQVLEEVVAPLRWGLRPSYFESAANRIATFAGPEFAKPAETLRCDIR